jgi:hypothetical protein
MSETMNSKYLTCCQLALPAIATMLLVSGCSQRHPAQSAAPPVPQDSQSPSAAPAAANVQSETAPAPEDSGSVVRGAFAPGGLATTYEAHFRDNQLQRITEQRKSTGGADNGNYGFYGARLMQYQGDALHSGARIELKFDMQGSVIASSSSAGKVSDAQINAIRTRGQMLRSHAMARRATQGHGTVVPVVG